MRRLSVVLAAAIVSCAPFTFRDLTSGRADPLLSPDGAWLLFVERREGNDEVVVSRPDGSERRNLSNHTAADRMATWSADGRAVYFCSRRTGDWDIYVVGLDGAGLRNLTSNPASDSHPRPSPDGARLLFTRDADVMIAGPDGSGAAAVARGYGAIWSPDGAWICYTSEDRLRVMKVDGGEQRDLAEGWPLCWTPDGAAIFFSRGGFVCRVERGGGGNRAVLKARVIDPRESRFAWSRGRLLLVTNRPQGRGQSGPGGPVILDAAGELVADLRESASIRWYDEAASWSPDGERVIYAGHGNGGWGGVFSAKAAGREEPKLVIPDSTP